MLHLKHKIIITISFFIFGIGALLLFNKTNHKHVLLIPIDNVAKTPLNKLPDFSKFKNVKEKKEAFFNTLNPIINEENTHILALRNTVELLQTIPFQQLTTQQKSWLTDLSKAYRVDSEFVSETSETIFFTHLLTKVDVLPSSLALAQAALESGWGSSRFSKQGNNLFGQWCFSVGCGMVPLSRDAGKAHEVATFTSVNHAVKSYLNNLNTNPSYTELRKKRALLRKEGKEISGILLAKTLNKYSEEGEVYVTKISKFIKQNNLQRYNTKFNKSLMQKSTP